MRIIDREEFFKMPAGTIYQEYEPQVFGPLQVFLGAIDNNTIAGDFYYTEFSEPAFGGVNSSHDLDDLLMDIRAGGESKSYPIVYGEVSRDGCFNRDQLYAVYERDDLTRMLFFLCEQVQRAYSK